MYLETHRFQMAFNTDSYYRLVGILLNVRYKGNVTFSRSTGASEKSSSTRERDRSIRRHSIRTMLFFSIISFFFKYVILTLPIDFTRIIRGSLRSLFIKIKKKKKTHSNQEGSVEFADTSCVYDAIYRIVYCTNEFPSVIIV